MAKEGRPGSLVLIDSSPTTWDSREELHFRFSRALMKRGLQPILVFSENLPDELQQRFRANGIEVTALNYAKGLLHFHRELGRLIKKHSVTDVHIKFFNYFSPIPWMAWLRGVRHIVFHEKNPGSLRASSLKLSLLRLRTRVMTWPVTKVIAISDFLRKQLINAGIPATKIHLVYDGIDLQRYLPDPTARERLVAQYSIRPEEIIVSTLTYLNPHKNVDVLIEACAEQAKRGTPVRLFVIGDGRMRKELEACGQKLGIADHIHWMGHILDPVPILQGTDVFVMPSVGEGLGLALLEAMACGAAGIAARSGALPEIAEEGKSAVLLPPRDVGALSDAIQQLARDKTLRIAIARRGLERVRRIFSADATIEGIMQVI